MIEDEASSYRILIVLLNICSLIFSIGMLVIIMKIRLIHERQGKLISAALIFETFFSFFMLLSQFYYITPNEYAVSFDITTSGYGCQLLGVLDVVCAFGYFSIINLYAFELLGILDGRSNSDATQRNLLTLIFSCMVAGFAFINSDIGFNNLGMCSLYPGLAFTIICITILAVSLLINITCCVILNENKKKYLMIASLKNTNHNRMKNQYINVNIAYLLTFGLTRILPVFLFTVFGQFASSKANLRLFYFFGLPISFGGICLSVIRSQEPIIMQYLIQLFKSKTKQKLELSLQLQQLNSNSHSSREITITDFEKKQSKPINPYLSNISTMRDSSQIYRQTYQENEIIVQKLSNEISSKKPKFPLLEFRKLYIRILELAQSDNIRQDNLEITSYQMRFIRQTRTGKSICSAFAEKVISQVFLIDLYCASFDPEQNIAFINNHQNLEEEISQITTFDGKISIEILSRSCKSYLIRYFLKPYILCHKAGSGYFLPQILGLYSILEDGQQFNVLMKINYLNTIQLEQMGYQIIGLFSYQYGQLNAEMTREYQDLRTRMKMKNKEDFLLQLNTNLSFLRDHYLWGYSLNILYVEHATSDELMPKMFRTNNGFILVNIDNLFDQFSVNADNKEYELIMNPDYYAAQLVMQIDKLL